MLVSWVRVVISVVVSVLVMVVDAGAGIEVIVAVLTSVSQRMLVTVQTSPLVFGRPPPHLDLRAGPAVAGRVSAMDIRKNAKDFMFGAKE